MLIMSCSGIKGRYFSSCHTNRSNWVVDRVSVPSPIAIGHNGEGQSSHVLDFCVKFEVHISVLVANYSCSFELVVGETIII